MYVDVVPVTQARWVASIAAALPVVAFVVVDPAGWYPFGPAKWWAVSVVAAVAVAAVVATGAVRFAVVATWVWGALLAWLAVAATFGADPVYAWIGTPERHLGWLTWLLLAGCFVVGCQFVERVEVDRVALGVVVASMLTGIYVVVELVAGRPVAIDAVTSRLGGPFGSAAYLGAAAALALPVCAGVALEADLARWWRLAGGAGATVLAVALIGSGARAAWVGVTAVGMLAMVRLLRDRRWRVLGAAAVVALVALVVVAPRVADVTVRPVPATSRLDEWTVAVRVIAAAPVVGVGPEGYRVAVGEHIDAGYEQRYGREVAPDRAHSGPLDIAAVGGLPAAVAYVVLMVMACVAGVDALRRLRPVLAGMGLGVVAYAVQQVLLFPITELDVVFWLLAGVVIAAGSARFRVVRATPGLRAATVTAAALALLLFVAGLAGVAADRVARQAVDAGPGPTGIELAERAVRLRPDAVRYRLLEAQLSERLGTLAGVDAAIDAVDAAMRWSPRDPIVVRSHAAYLSRRAEITGAPSDVGAALAAWVEVVEGDPNCWRCHLGLGSAAALAGDTDLAAEAWTAAAALSDDPLADQLLADLAEIERR